MVKYRYYRFNITIRNICNTFSPFKILIITLPYLYLLIFVESNIISSS